MARLTTNNKLSKQQQTIGMDSDDIIDLCDSFILADHRGLTDALIEIDTDDSLILLDLENSSVELAHHSASISSTIEIEVLQSVKPKRSNKSKPSSYIQHKQKNALKTQKKIYKAVTKENRNALGDCPICFDELGQNPLASTKCGHVYCMKCIKKHLLADQRCPTCRKILKGASSYHPLYLST